MFNIIEKIFPLLMIVDYITVIIILIAWIWRFIKHKSKKEVDKWKSRTLYPLFVTISILLLSIWYNYVKNIVWANNMPNFHMRDPNNICNWCWWGYWESNRNKISFSVRQTIILDDSWKIKFSWKKIDDKMVSSFDLFITEWEEYNFWECGTLQEYFKENYFIYSCGWNNMSQTYKITQKVWWVEAIIRLNWLYLSTELYCPDEVKTSMPILQNCKRVE